ncbi:GNAT family N-acetyltransferase [Pseudofulvibacter geojedonensis]|uniref:GNAT family N-acetyltransferase n=1 Tax=Pseudofulvibacter geojedonensis TaxID=1123758 RepID=A0ABW3I0Q5_9FLAO
MEIQIKKIAPSNILTILPLMVEYTKGKVHEDILKERFLEMVTQNYECIGMYYEDELIGMAGLWFMTRHYSGKSVEPDHVYIANNYRRKGLGKRFFDWIHNYAKEKGCKTSELNTYVQNYPSHKFYYNEGYEIYGYHFYKTL